ncbi:mannitol dehydrogenase family protein [Anaerobiospirillum thomasii]|uniref:Polyol:NADP oxidoreductase n=1 Tax=Anaerobiospirillum thomasii TaxID=179995 RepID=A0A2X0VTG1_9GAMM|nr:mannitol dehydrogenase family protein [Anaerobiospirillum thomasii]SPT71000.1 Polyol:NADP oxidoreductase [Anaerobiospirillum thomasii]
MSLLSHKNNMDLIALADKDHLLSVRDELIANTNIRPQWLHFGSGNIFRSYIALIAQKLQAKRLMDTGIVICEAYDEEILSVSYKQSDNISLSATLNFDGTTDVTPVLSVTKALCLNQSREDREFYLHALTQPSLQIISFSITEKAYELEDASGHILPYIQKDLSCDLQNVSSILPLLLLGLVRRFENGALPLTLMALDNCKHNGDKLKKSLLKLCDMFIQEGKLSAKFKDYLANKIAFPLSMIDKIAPRPDKDVLLKLRALGYTLDDIHLTAKGTYTADFVNSEKTAYLVIEDNFKNSRPPFEQAEIIMTDRASVMLCENMKIESCLNPLQTAAAIAGMLFNYTYISECMEDEIIVSLVKKLGAEGILVVDDPKVLNPKDFLDEAIELRMPNPYINDTPSRIATDSSSKIAIRLGLSVRRYIAKKIHTDDLVAIPLVYALFVRYCAGIDDNLEPYTLPNDLNYNYIKSIGSKLNVIKADDTTLDAVLSVLENETIMGCNLKEAAIFDRVKKLVLSMCQGKGSIRQTLAKELSV